MTLGSERRGVTGSGERLDELGVVGPGDTEDTLSVRLPGIGVTEVPRRPDSQVVDVLSNLAGFDVRRHPGFFPMFHKTSADGADPSSPDADFDQFSRKVDDLSAHGADRFSAPVQLAMLDGPARDFPLFYGRTAGASDHAQEGEPDATTFAPRGLFDSSGRGATSGLLGADSLNASVSPSHKPGLGVLRPEIYEKSQYAPSSLAESGTAPAPKSGAAGPSSVDFGKIVEWEGGNHLATYGVGPKWKRDAKGAVLLNPDGTRVVDHWFDRSGISVGQGVDLGQRSPAELKRWGLTDPEIDVLRPLMTARGKAAYDAPHVQLDPALVAKLNTGAKQELVGGIGRDYNRARSTSSPRSAGQGGKVGFDQLPTAASTVIGSMGYNMGAGNLKASSYWPLIVNNDWAGLAEALGKDKSKLASRRHGEGDYLRSAIQRGELGN